MTELEYSIRNGGMHVKSMVRRITRRGFSSALLGASCAPLLNAAVGPDFTIAIIPDPQFLAATCPDSGGSYYSRLFNWIVANRNLSLTSSYPTFSANIKAVVGVGDCVNGYDRFPFEFANASAAWSILDSAGIAWTTPPGNHDYATNTASSRAYNTMFSAGGFFSSGTRASVYGSGINLGGGDRALWSGSYDSSGACTAVKFSISGINMLFIAMDFFAGTSQWAWAYNLAQANPTHECYITTHAWLTMYGAQFQRTDVNGPNVFGMGPAPYSNSAYEAWQNVGVNTWPTLCGIFGGHDINPPGNPGAWYWQRTPVVSSSARNQTVQQLFANAQELDSGCSGIVNRSTGAGELAHVFLLSRRPSLGLLEGRMLSTQTGDWIGANQWYGTETLLFSVPFAGLGKPYALPA